MSVSKDVLGGGSRFLCVGYVVGDDDWFSLWVAELEGGGVGDVLM